MSPDENGRSRLRFEDLGSRSFPDGRVRIRVDLEWRGTLYSGESRGTDTLEGQTRASALATLQSAQQATRGTLSLELMGVKAIRAFDAWVVIVSVRGRSADDEYSLIGCSACREDTTNRGACLAVLDALNRILEKYVR